MSVGATDIVIVVSLFGVSILALLVVLPVLITRCIGFRGCLQCGSELSNGAGKCLMCGQAWRTPGVELYAWMHRVCHLEEPGEPEAVPSRRVG